VRRSLFINTGESWFRRFLDYPIYSDWMLYFYIFGCLSEALNLATDPLWAQTSAPGTTAGASVASAFFWYDLEKEQQTTLQVWPFCWMEANSFFEQGYSAEQGFEELQQYHNVVKQVNGLLMTLEHNHFVTEQPQWVDWRNGYKAFLQRNFG